MFLLQSPFSKLLPTAVKWDVYARSIFLWSDLSACLNRACCLLALETLRLSFSLAFSLSCRLKAFRSDRQLSYVWRSAQTFALKPILKVLFAGRTTREADKIDIGVTRERKKKRRKVVEYCTVLYFHLDGKMSSQDLGNEYAICLSVYLPILPR